MMPMHVSVTWRPASTEPAKCLDKCTFLLAIPPEDGAEFWALAGEIYAWDARAHCFVGEDTGVPLQLREFMWLPEGDLFAGLPPITTQEPGHA